VLILDRNKNPVPVGFAGELYLSGICLGLGYLNDEEKTQAAFVENRFPEIGYDRLYKTGDLVRYLPDGNIEFLGRLDHQVKIRGFRIELGEIEYALRGHPAIREAIVLARKDDPGGKRLVAYVVPDQEPPPTPSELRSFLKSKLPEYMAPSDFVVLQSLPLTPNGKVDRRALPTPDRNRADLQETFVAPRTLAEQVTAGIWAEVLKLEKVGIHDNFFDLGGHSLLATQVVSRIRAAFQVELPLRSLFEKPTVVGLAEAIMQSLADNAEPNRTADILTRIESLSDEEAECLLARES
jgi:surfactin family lipopeptide synthetase C